MATNLTKEEIRQIRILSMEGYSKMTIAAVMGRSRSAIRRVLRGANG